MDRNLAEQTVTDNLKRLYGFALAKTGNRQDAEDLAQEIAAKLYSALLVTEVAHMGAFIRRVARNTLANYYRGKARSGIGIPIDDLAEILPDDSDTMETVAKAEAVGRLQREIAYLSGLQRQIVILYYYEGKPQEDIARLLSIPVGTVKWHLFEAKKDLKKGMETMRQLTELKFNPIKFNTISTNGSVGTMGHNGNFLRSALAQNIAYAVWKDGKTVNELADILGVSPVFIENEAAYLEENGFLLKQGGRYLANILIEEATDAQTRLRNDLYEEAAGFFAPALFDALNASETLSSVTCGRRDRNFLMWALFPYIATRSGEDQLSESVTFDEAATLRPDGGKNICSVTVSNSSAEPPKHLDSLLRMFGPCWNASEKLILWTLDTEWSGRRIEPDHYHLTAQRDLTLLGRFVTGGSLSADEYALMAERGYLKPGGGLSGDPAALLQVVFIRDAAALKQLLVIGDGLKEKYKARFEALKAPYVKAMLEGTPKQLRKMLAFQLQYMFYSDDWFLIHCLKMLVNTGRLTPPPEDQKKSLTTLVVVK